MYQCVGTTHLVNRQSKNIKNIKRTLNSTEPHLKADLRCFAMTDTVVPGKVRMSFCEITLGETS